MTDNTAQVDEKVEDQKVEPEVKIDAADLHDSSFEDIIQESQDKPVEETKPDAPEVTQAPETPKVEDKPIEQPAQEPKPAEPVTPPIDTDKLKEEISEATAKKLLEQLAPEDATKAEKKDILENAPWKKENRQPSWDEALKYMAEVNKAQVKDEILQELNQEAEKIEADEKKAAETKAQQEQQTQTAWNNYWNGQIADLETQGKIPKVVDQTDPNDPGRKARIALFAKMNEMAVESAAKKQPINLNLKEIFYEHYTPPEKQEVAGADAPVAGVGKSVTSGKSDNFSAAEIHNKSYEDILLGN